MKAPPPPLALLLALCPLLSRAEDAGGVAEGRRGAGTAPVAAASLPAAAAATQPYDHGAPTAHEQLLLELVNRARANPSAEAARLGIGLNDGLPPGTISTAPKAPLAMNPRLLAAARAHSQWMLDTNTFSHTGQGGSLPEQRMQAAGYVFSGSWASGENIAWRGSTGALDLAAQTHSTHDGLFRSPPHRDNICAEEFDEVGMGLRTGSFTDRGTRYNALMTTQNFARSASTPGPLILGVVYQDADGDGLYDPGEGLGGVVVAPEGGSWHAVTAESGGYAVPVTANTAVRLTFSGGPLPVAQSRTVNMGTLNQKVDLLLTAPRELAFVPGSLAYSAAAGFSARVTGTSGTVFSLQHSENLRSWTTMGTYTLGAAPLTVSHRSGGPAGYYRLVWTP